VPLFHCLVLYFVPTLCGFGLVLPLSMVLLIVLFVVLASIVAYASIPCLFVLRNLCSELLNYDCRICYLV
jgi:hypothetical protein